MSTLSKQNQKIRDCFKDVPLGGSKRAETPLTPLNNPIVPQNSVLFCRYTRTVTMNSKNRQHIGKRYVLIRSYKGVGDIIIDRTYYTIEPGDMILICPYQFHNYANIQEEVMTWLFWAFDLPDNLDISHYGQQVLKSNSHIDEVLLRLSETYIQNKGSNLSKANRIILQGAEALNEILMHNTPRQSDYIDSSNGTVSDDLLLRSVIDYINKHISEPIEIEQLAKYIGYSVSHLRRRFQAQCDVPISKFIREFRVKRSVNLITSSNLSMSQIAYECGFQSLSTFYRVFQQTIGMSPKEYKKSYKNKELPADITERLSPGL